MKRILALLAVAVMLFSATLGTFAAESQSTSYTVTLSTDGRPGISQDAYLLLGSYLDLGLNSPQDMFIYNDIMYIADTNNSRIVIVDLKASTATSIGEGVLKTPVAVAADNDGKIYVADSASKEAYRFSAEGILEQVFAKPTTPNFGINQGYNPVKIAAAEAGGCYIISEGSQAGIVHMSGNAEFLGYFASNEVSVSLYDLIVDAILTEEQKRRFLKRTPPSFGNLFRGSDGLIYTMNMGAEVVVKKHSISGLNMLSKAKRLPKIDNPADMCVTEDGRIIVVNQRGTITEITSDGYLLCQFGGNTEGTDRNGLFSEASGIGTDSAGNIYVADKGRNFVQVFAPTQVQMNIHRAVDLYNNGEYAESKALLEEVLKFNNTSFFAHFYMAKNYMQESNYEMACEHFQIANSRDEYSEAYWEIRNLWLQNNLIYAILILIVFGIICWILGLLDKKYHIFNFWRKFKKLVRSSKLCSDVLQVGYALKHPIDNAYEVRVGHVGSVLGATILFALLFVEFVIYQVGSGFIFSVDPSRYSLSTVLMYFVIGFGLFIIGNFFISSINDGNGTLKTIYITTAYSFAPAIILLPFVILFANVATMNESFIITTLIGVILAWILANIVVSFIEIHAYRFSEVVKSLLLTLFFMIVAILAASVGYLMLKQIFDFFIDIFTEVSLRV